MFLTIRCRGKYIITDYYYRPPQYIIFVVCSELHDVSNYIWEILVSVISWFMRGFHDHYSFKGTPTRTRSQRILRQARSSCKATIAVSRCQRAARHMFSERGRRISAYVSRICIEGLCHYVYNNKKCTCAASRRRCSTARHCCLAHTVSWGLYGISVCNAEV